MNINLSSLRTDIEDIDANLCTLLQTRDSYVHEIAQCKRQSSTHLFDPRREQMLYTLYSEKGYDYPNILKEILAHSRYMQGVLCYVLNAEDILFAKLALGFATKVEHIHEVSSHYDALASIFYLPHTSIENINNLYPCATYYI
ncbi:MAG: chorismate mutase, partial [Desulfovibrionaceae bacterium]|nr:chorismate mutase [Desulfovibrionaceae bacterium]